MSIPPTQARSLYRQLLRELPSRSPSLLANPSNVQKHLRASFEAISPSPTATTSSSSSPPAQSVSPIQKFQEAEQYLSYLRAQRTYTALLERYNPGMNMDDEERVRLSARRVGMEMPIEVPKGGKGE